MNTIHSFSMSTEYCRLASDRIEPIFEVLCKVSACVDDRHLKIMAEFNLGEPNFEVLRKVSACDDDRHFTKTLQFPHAFKGHSPAIRARLNAGSIPGAVIKSKW